MGWLEITYQNVVAERILLLAMAGSRLGSSDAHILKAGCGSSVKVWQC